MGRRVDGDGTAGRDGDRARVEEGLRLEGPLHRSRRAVGHDHAPACTRAHDPARARSGRGDHPGPGVDAPPLRTRGPLEPDAGRAGIGRDGNDDQIAVDHRPVEAGPGHCRRATPLGRHDRTPRRCRRTTSRQHPRRRPRPRSGASSSWTDHCVSPGRRAAAHVGADAVACEQAAAIEHEHDDQSSASSSPAPAGLDERDAARHERGFDEGAEAPARQRTRFDRGTGRAQRVGILHHIRMRIEEEAGLDDRALRGVVRRRVVPGTVVSKTEPIVVSRRLRATARRRAAA